MTSPVSDSDSPSGERAGTLTAGAIAGLVSGDLRGSPDTVVHGVAPLSRATPGQLSFLGDRRYAGALEKSDAGVVLITKALANSPGSVPSRIIVDNPQAALLQILPRFYPEPSSRPSIHHTVSVGRGARIGSGVTLEPFVVIGEGATVSDGAVIGAHCVVGAAVMIGERCRLFPHVTVYAGSALGRRVQVHSGVRIGSDGFGYVSNGSGHAKIQHVGRCIVEDDVEIGANTTIDRGSIDDTIIGAGTKIDNLVQVGHNVKIGKLCLIMAQVGIAGSAQIGDGCVLAGQAGLGGHITVGAGARIAGQSGVFGDVPAGETWSGYPARPHRESLRATGALFRIAGMMKRLEQVLDAQGAEKT
ncbi:MAG TPA: UDP-3-O-(3-hydroxymyristoyl)glucosamine N-acyltransferase [Gemmatimonadaceae bacterium]|nr:UDP-3-O-(3-hydroxymyristoyl)glucosamine N-acyltransferase [Gemmatimonadaceae bacterium]